MKHIVKIECSDSSTQLLDLQYFVRAKYVEVAQVGKPKPVLRLTFWEPIPPVVFEGEAATKMWDYLLNNLPAITAI